MGGVFHVEEPSEETHLVEDSVTDEEALIDELEETELKNSSLITVFLSLYVGVFLAALDGTIVATLLSRIASDFNEFRSVSWIATGYLISQAAFQPLYGKLSDIFGRKPLLLICNILFGLGSVLCGLSQSIWFLVFARVIAGSGGGGLFSLSAITLSDIVSLRQRGMLQGIGNILYGCGAAFGGIVGGVLTETIGWRWTFIMQGPIIVLSILAIAFNLHLPPVEYDDNKLSRIDFKGSLTLVLSLILFLFGISVGGNFYAWTSAVVVLPLSLAIIVFLVFVYVELYVAREPVIPLHLLKNRTVAGSAFTSLFMIIVYFSNIFYTALYAVSVKGASAKSSGSILIPQFVGSALGSLVSGYYMRATGRYKSISVVAALLLVLGCALLTTIGADTPQTLVSSYLLLPGFGSGLLLTITLVSLIAAVPHEYQAVCTSISYGFRGVGSTLGVSTAAAIFQNVLAYELHYRITGPDSESIIRRVQDSVEEIDRIPESYKDEVIASYLGGIRAVLFFSTLCSIGAAVSCMFMKEHVLHNSVNRR
ncbi:major facilitator superfamily domain-containing protein [Dipodascopsis uninucleata]